MPGKGPQYYPMKTQSAWLAVLALTLLPATAAAQSRPWIADRAIGEGMGIRTGDFELHPGLAGELGYDSNYFQRSGTAPPLLPAGVVNPGCGQYYCGVDQPIYAAYRLRITPSLTLSTIGTQRHTGDTRSAAPPQFTFRSGLFASYNELFAAGNSYDFSSQRHIDGGATLGFDILPERPFSLDGSGSYTHTVAPSNDPAVVNSWNRDLLGVGAGATWRPGGGLFDWRLGYDLRYTYFEAATYRYLTNANHALGTRGRFKFLPRTALIYEATANFVRYANADAPRNDGDVVQAKLGLNGLITNRFSLLATVGWAATFYVPTATPVLANYDSIIGQAEFDWYVLPQPKLQPGDATVGLSVIGLGYVRDIAVSYLADYYRRDRVYAKASYFIGGRFLVDLQGGYSRITHPAFEVRASGQPFSGATEDRVDAQLFTEYRTSDSLGLNATFRYDASLTNETLKYIPAAANQPYLADNLAFSRFQAWLGVRWFM
jgi:hypothetical protein